MTDIDQQILTGDASERLRDLPADSIHMVMTSPPYWQQRDYDAPGQIGLENTLDAYIDELSSVFEEIHRVLRPDGSVWLNLGDTYQNKQKMLVPHRVAIRLQESGWIVRNDATWKKPNTMPASVTDRLNTTTEQVFHLTPEPHYFYDLDAIREPHKEQSLQRQTRQTQSRGGIETYGQAEHTGFADDNHLHSAGKNPGDVFEVSTKPFSEAHFGVYPAELCKKPIKATCPRKVCAECGTPYERQSKTITIWEKDPADCHRDQTQRAVELAHSQGLEEKHFQAARAVGIGNTDGSEGNPYHRVDDQTARLAKETKSALGSYYREALLSESQPDGWTQNCDCETDATEPGIALDPFAGAGTTCLAARNLGRRFCGIELNPDYVALAQKRLGLTVDNPEHIRKNEDQTSLSAFTN